MNEITTRDEQNPARQLAKGFPRTPRLLLPGVSLVFFWALSFIVAAFDKPYFFGFMYGVLSTALLTLLFLGWWWFNRGLLIWEKCAGFILLVVGAWLFGKQSHRSITFFAVWMVGFPIVASLIISWLYLARRFTRESARIGVAVLTALGWSWLALVRFDGADSTLRTRSHWRWTPTREEQFLAEANSRAASSASPRPSEAAGGFSTGPDWTNFRGTNRDGVILGSSIATNWTENPPALVWKRSVGPAWSSLLVVGKRVYTQEQRGEKEAVVCYDALNGEPIWVHEDNARFDESVSGPGPRGTPTYSNGKLYTLGGTGLLTCLDATTGQLHWSRDIKSASDAKIPMWGFSSSPLVSGEWVIVYAGGESGKSLIAYRIQSGDLAWSASAGVISYSSPQLTYIAGVPQCLMLHDGGLTAVDVTNGKELWKIGVALKNTPRSGQPRLVDGNKLLVGALSGIGCSLIEVSHNKDSWIASTQWDSRDLKPEFPDFVVYDGYAYGFDIGLFCCLKIADGKRAWKEGRYGRGQVMLLLDQHLLLVLSETGELVLIAPDPAAHREIARFQAINGKTWNHPVVVGDRLYLRNADEMACYSFSSRSKKVALRD